MLNAIHDICTSRKLENLDHRFWLRVCLITLAPHPGHNQLTLCCVMAALRLMRLWLPTHIARTYDGIACSNPAVNLSPARAGVAASICDAMMYHTNGVLTPFPTPSHCIS